MKLVELRSACLFKLHEHGSDRPEYVADLIISKQLGIPRALLITRYDIELSPHKCEGIISMVERRLNNEPLSYILGEAEFYGRSFKVGTGCLIPRPETELLVEALLELSPNAPLFADWCTGSGCIGITLLHEMRDSEAYGIDSSQEALEWCAMNSEIHGMTDRFKLICESNPVKCLIGNGSLDFIVANPPYIPSHEVDGLMSDVRDYEPHEALDGGEDGTEIALMILSAAPIFLRHGGLLAMEIAGEWQIEKLLDAAAEHFEFVRRIYDYNHIARHAILRYM